MARHYLEKSKINLTNTKTDFSFVSTYEEYRLTAFMLLDNLRKIGVALDLKPDYPDAEKNLNIVKETLNKTMK